MSRLLYKISDKNGGQNFDLIFVHGLYGRGRIAWQSEQRNETFCWPIQIGQDSSSAVWIVEYSFGDLQWSNKKPLTGLATNLLSSLKNSNIGARPLLFVAHDLGGLIIKQLILCATSVRDSRWEKITQSAKGFIFISVPNSTRNITPWFENCFMEKIKTDKINLSLDTLNDHRDEFLRLNNSWANEFNEIDRQLFFTPNLEGNLVNEEVLNPDLEALDPTISPYMPYRIFKHRHDSIHQPCNSEADLYIQALSFIKERFSSDIDTASNGDISFRVESDTILVPRSTPKISRNKTNLVLAKIHLWKQIHYIAEALSNRLRPYFYYIYTHSMYFSSYQRNNFPLNIREDLQYIIEDFLPNETSVIRTMINNSGIDLEIEIETPLVKYLRFFLNISKILTVIRNAIGADLDKDSKVSERIQSWLDSALQQADLVLKTYIETKLEE